MTDNWTPNERGFQARRKCKQQPTTDLVEQRRLEVDQVVERLRLELEQLRAENHKLRGALAIEAIRKAAEEIKRLTAALQEIEFHGGPAAAMARHALEPKP